MDEQTLARLHAEQVGILGRLALGRLPPKVVPDDGASEAAVHVREKYVHLVSNCLDRMFPALQNHRPVGPDEIASRFGGVRLHPDRFHAVDDLFRVLRRIVRPARPAAAWRDLLLLERGRAKAYHVQPISKRRAITAMRSIAIGRCCFADLEACFCVRLSTDLVFGYPSMDPRRARLLETGAMFASIFRNARTSRTEIVF